jgi:hypothetical protein
MNSTIYSRNTRKQGHSQLSIFFALADLWWGYIKEYNEFGSISCDCVWVAIGMGVHDRGSDLCACDNYNGIGCFDPENLSTMDFIPRTSIVPIIVSTGCSIGLDCVGWE